MSRRKRASMREGPLADLFRSTSDDARRSARGAATAADPVAEARSRRAARAYGRGGAPRRTPRDGRARRDRSA